MPKYLTEILDELNKNPKLALSTYKDDNRLKIIFQYAYLKDKKFNLPKGTPPYNENAKPQGLTETNLLFELRKLAIFIRKDLQPLKIESIFISLLEALHPEEAEILIAIKEQKLNKIYKKLSRNFAIKYGYIIDDKPKKDKAQDKELDLESSK